MPYSQKSLLLMVSIIVTIGFYPWPSRAQSPDRCDRKFDYSRDTLQVRLGYVFFMPPPSSLDELRSSPSSPLEVKLVAVDKPTYAINESIVYDLRLSNRSNQPLMVPIAHRPIFTLKKDYSLLMSAIPEGYRLVNEYPIGQLVDAYPNGYREMALEFHVREGLAESKSETFEAMFDLGFVAFSYILYGSPDVPGSLRRLDPGHCLTFRIYGCLEKAIDYRRNEILGRKEAMSTSLAVYLYQPGDRVFGKAMLPGISNSLPITILGQEAPKGKRCPEPIKKLKTKKVTTKGTK
jgi:hypothetical protein